MSTKDIQNLRRGFLEQIKNIKDVKSLEELRVKFLGRKSKLTVFLRSLKNLSIQKRREFGPRANALRVEFDEAIRKKLSQFSAVASQLSHVVDLTMPGKKVTLGHLHPLTLIEQEVIDIFTAMGFSVVEGLEIETEYYNFDALNIPKGHPAREMWDTFWLCELKRAPTRTHKGQAKYEVPDTGRKNLLLAPGDKILLRTHTSPVQVRYMETHRPPFQIIVPGRVFRYEATDASHEVNFYQVEGLMVGTKISLANFKYVIEEFLRRLFREQKIDFRFRPSYFPFVEPGLEVDIKLAARRKPQATSRWLEIMGAGMVHPRVFEYAHYNPRDLQGFAFGVGLDRLAMIKYNVPDIRLFYSGDLRFIGQF